MAALDIWGHASFLRDPRTLRVILDTLLATFDMWLGLLPQKVNLNVNRFRETCERIDRWSGPVSQGQQDFIEQNVAAVDKA